MLIMLSIVLVLRRLMGSGPAPQTTYVAATVVTVVGLGIFGYGIVNAGSEEIGFGAGLVALGFICLARVLFRSKV